MPTTRAPRNFEVLGVRRRGFSTARTPTSGGLSTVANAVSLQTTGSGTSSVAASMSLSRTSGPAPLPVFFDATGTTSTVGLDTFRQVGCAFNFGDAAAGTWARSGRSKNVQRGAPLGAKVYESAGTFIAKMKARNSSGGAGNGDTSQVSEVITVFDPDLYFSAAQGRATFVISRTSDTTGAPAGATVLINQTSWPSFASDRRYLLHRGQDFSSFGSVNLSNLNGTHIGAFGSGTKPIISGLNHASGSVLADPNWSRNIVVMDVAISGAVGGPNSYDGVLLLRCDVTGGVALAGLCEYNFDNVSSSVSWPRNTFLFECDIQGSYNALTGYGRNVAILGCEIHHPSNEHGIRWWLFYKALWEENYVHHVSPLDTIRHHMKLQGGGSQAFADLMSSSRSPASRYGVLRRNTIGAVGESNNDWMVSIGPEHDSAGQGVEDVIVENNSFEADHQTEVTFGGRRMTSRGNANTVGTLNESNGSHVPGLPGGAGGPWNGEYFLGGSTITTEDPT